jgi:hypothetical protein
MKRRDLRMSVFDKDKKRSLETEAKTRLEQDVEDMYHALELRFINVDH